eukprot:TRINITY_DN1867_c1_g1_i1.p1 TRINITY_DN1867_c1_g1~~TRINITY_DN1867_c1_g1_i1.p1  ORF type:complete len:511 (+),score=126.73 TRINITY_DN1867_c1_g1_i1:272-1804(+)
MLFEFARKQGDKVQCVYYLSGRKQGRHIVSLVAQDALAEAKKNFENISALHVYSVQTAIPKDSAELWTVDHIQVQALVKEKPQQNALFDNRYSSIYCAAAAEKRKPKHAMPIPPLPEALAKVKGGIHGASKATSTGAVGSNSSSPEQPTKAAPPQRGRTAKKAAATTPKVQGINKAMMTQFFKPAASGVKEKSKTEPPVDPIENNAYPPEADFPVAGREKTKDQESDENRDSAEESESLDIKRLTKLSIEDTTEQETKRRLRKGGDRKRKRESPSKAPPTLKKLVKVEPKDEPEVAQTEENEDQDQDEEPEEVAPEPTKKKRRVAKKNVSVKQEKRHRQDEMSDGDSESEKENRKAQPLKRARNNARRHKSTVKEEEDNENDNDQDGNDNDDEAEYPFLSKKPTPLGKAKPLAVLPQALRERGEKKRVLKTKFVENAKGYKEAVDYWEEVDEPEEQEPPQVNTKQTTTKPPPKKLVKTEPTNENGSPTKEPPKRTQANIFSYFTAAKEKK